MSNCKNILQRINIFLKWSQKCVFQSRVHLPTSDLPLLNSATQFLDVTYKRHSSCKIFLIQVKSSLPHNPFNNEYFIADKLQIFTSNLSVILIGRSPISSTKYINVISFQLHPQFLSINSIVFHSFILFLTVSISLK